MDHPTVYGLVLCGAPGLGKTGLAVSAAHRTIEMQTGEGSPLRRGWELAARIRGGVENRAVQRIPVPVWYEEWDRLQMRLRAAQAKGEEFSALKWLESVDLLVLDEVDSGTLTPWKEAVLKRLVDRVNYRKRVVLCANSDPSALAGFLGERVADRIADKTMYAVLHWVSASLRTGHG